MMNPSDPGPKPSGSIAENEHVKLAVNTSQQYFRYVLAVLKKPAQVGTTAGQAQFLNGIITQSLLTFLIPLMSYVAMLSLPSFIRPSFFGTALRMWFYLILMMVCVNGVIFLFAKLGKSGASIKDVAGRLGTLLVLPLTLVLVAFVAALIRLSDLASLALGFGLLGLLAAIVLTLYTFKKESAQPEQGIDAFYGIMVTFLILLIVFYLIGRSMVFSVMGGIF